MLKVFRHASRCPFLWDLTPYHWMIGRRITGWFEAVSLDDLRPYHWMIWRRITGWFEAVSLDDLTPYHWMIGTQRCEKALWFYLQWSHWDSSCTFSPLKMRPPCCVETSGANHSVPRCRIPEEGRPQLRHCGSLKTRNYKKKKLNSVALVRTRTIPTERPPPVGEVSTNFCDRGVSRGQRNGSPQPLISVF